MDFNNDKKKANNALKNQKQSEALARKKESELKKATADFNRKKEAADRQAEAEKATHKAASKKMEMDVKKLAQQADLGKLRSEKAKKLITNLRSRLPIDKAFNSAMTDVFKNMSKSPSKMTTARYQQLSYKAKGTGSESINALKTALLHVLRFENQKRDTLEWHDELLNQNVYFYEGEYYSHDEIEPIRQEIFDKIINDKLADINNEDDIQNKKDVKKLSTYRSNYKSKILKLAPDDEVLKKAISNLESNKYKLATTDNQKVKKHTEKLKRYIDNLIDKGELERINNDEKPSPIGRLEAKKKLFTTFLKHREGHIKALKFNRTVNRSDTAIISEQNFKLPHAQGNFDISGKEYLESMNSFFQKHFPFNKILTSVCHLDESISTDPNQRTGDNIHLVLELKNNQTNQYDWRLQQINFARKNQKMVNEKYGLNFDIPEDTDNLTKEQICHVGQLMQISFIQHMQDQIFTKKGYCIRFLNEQERSEHKYILSILEQNKPLSQRSASRAAMFEDHIAKQQQEIKEKQKEDKNLDKSITSKGKQKKELSSEIFGMLGQKDELTKDIENLENKALEQALTKVNAWMRNIKKDDNSDGFTALTASAAGKAIDKLSEEQPEIAKQVAKTAVTFEKGQDKAIEEHLKVSNKVKSNIEYNTDDLKQIEENQKLCIHNKDPQKCRTCSAKGGSGSKFKI